MISPHEHTVVVLDIYMIQSLCVTFVCAQYPRGSGNSVTIIFVFNDDDDDSGLGKFAVNRM